MRKHHSVLGGVALALALALAGCSDNSTDPDAEDTPTETPTTAPSSATPTPKTPEEKALAQLEAYLDVRDDAYRAGTINFKRLNKVATGNEFLLLQQVVAEHSSAGFTISGNYVHALGEPNQRSDTTVQVTDCEDASGVEFLTSAGKPVKDLGPDNRPLPEKRSVRYTVSREKGRWLVSEATFVLIGGKRVESC